MTNIRSFRLLFLEPSVESNSAIAQIYVEDSHARGQNRLLLTPPAATWEEFQAELHGVRMELAELEREAELRFADFAARRYAGRLWHTQARRRL